MNTRTVPGIPTDRKIHTVRVLDSQPLTPTAHLICATRPEDLAFHASSSVRLTLETAHDAESRPISMASSPTRNHLEWIVRVLDSEWKRAFALLKRGDTI